MTYILHKRILADHGPLATPIESFPEFRPAWSYALDYFAQAGYTIVGCHLEPEFPHSPAYAEFFVVRHGSHYTYFIAEAK